MLYGIDTYDETSPLTSKAADSKADGNDDVEMEAVNSAESDKEYEVLVRCTNGSDLNFSTRVSTVVTTILPTPH